jgi:nitroreductase
METFVVIRKRRSMHEHANEAIPKADLETMVVAGYLNSK